VRRSRSVDAPSPWRESDGVFLNVNFTGFSFVSGALIVRSVAVVAPIQLGEMKCSRIGKGSIRVLLATEISDQYAWSLRLATYGIQDLRVRRRSASISNVKKWRYPRDRVTSPPFVATGHSTSVDTSRRRALGYFFMGALAIITVDRGAKDRRTISRGSS